MPRPWLTLTLAVALIAAQAVFAHEHHEDKIEEGQAVSQDPIDSTLWAHILLQILAWGLLFPLGMVLGIVRSKWHVPVQVVATCIAIVCHFLGHKHKGRQFKHSAHSAYAPWLELLLTVQVGLGIYLKLHIERGFLGKLKHIRPAFVLAHGIVGKALPVASWVQMIFGGIAALGFCWDDHLGQCVAHFIMGSAFIAYGIVLTMALLVGQAFIRRTGRSQEFFDSCIIAAWGVVNTFTEHHWGGPWAHNDLQHTSMGIVWWCAGLVGIWLSSSRGGRPKRNVIPGFVILLTGYAMSAHPQSLPLSTMVHTAFGWTLMAAGASRIVEICFVLRDKQSLSLDGSDPNSFQYVPVFLLYASGFLFMGATEEQMKLLSDAHVTHVSYILILYSIAFLTFLYVNILLHVYSTSGPEYTILPPRRRHHRSRSTMFSTGSAKLPDDDEEVGAFGHPGLNGEPHHGGNGGRDGFPARTGGGALSAEERREMRDVQEFELDALISGGEDSDEEEGAAGAGTDEKRRVHGLMKGKGKEGSSGSSEEGDGRHNANGHVRL